MTDTKKPPYWVALLFGGAGGDYSALPVPHPFGAALAGVQNCS